VAEQKDKEQKKLGAVTYADPDKTEQPISIAGITFMPGEAVNLDELMTNEEQATRLKEKLAGNPYFKVEGGPDHKKTAEARQEHEQEAQEKRQKLDEKKTQQEQQRAQRIIEAGRPEQPTLEHREQPRSSAPPRR
jgi:hypothetical protein